MRTILLTLVALATSAFSQVDLAPAKAAAQAAISKGEWKDAKTLLEPIARQFPDDTEANYWLAQTYRNLGDLENAEKTTQWLLDLRPEFTGGLWEAALLREQFDDLPGAVDLLNIIYHRTPRSDAKTRTAILEDLARIFTKQKKSADVEILRREIQKLKSESKGESQ
jgi:tetratricopeptide (TPR) repeat protein